MWSVALSYRSTLDGLNYVNVEVRPLPMKFWGKFSRAFNILVYTCMDVKHGLSNYTLVELCVGCC